MMDLAGIDAGVLTCGSSFDQPNISYLPADQRLHA